MPTPAILLWAAPTASCMMVILSSEIAPCAGDQLQAQRKNSFCRNPALNWHLGMNISGGLYQRSAFVLFPFLVLRISSLLWWKIPAWLFSWLHTLGCFLVYFRTYSFSPSILQIIISWLIILWANFQKSILFKRLGSNTEFLLWTNNWLWR